MALFWDLKFQNWIFVFVPFLYKWRLDDIHWKYTVKNYEIIASNPCWLFVSHSRLSVSSHFLFLNGLNIARLYITINSIHAYNISLPLTLLVKNLKFHSFMGTHRPYLCSYCTETIPDHSLTTFSTELFHGVVILPCL